MNLKYATTTKSQSDQSTRLARFARAATLGLATLVGCASAPQVTKPPASTGLEFQNFSGTRTRSDFYHYRGIGVGDIIGTPDRKIVLKILDVNWIGNYVKFEVYYDGKSSDNVSSLRFNEKRSYVSSLYGNSSLGIEFKDGSGSLFNATMVVTRAITSQ